jgi:ABC-type Zn uptake system ZnuABC Zn-binding protein ZnuA
MRFKLLLGLVSLLCLIIAGQSQAEVRVVTSTTDLASIAKIIGGDNVKVESICRGAADPHFVQLLPSYMVKVGRADIYLKVGMDLDYWADQIIDGSQNGKLVIVDCSQNIEPVEVPTGQVNASMGDIHIKGNPHYWLAPGNGIPIAEVITDALKRVDPKNDESYDKGFQEFQTALQAKMDQWRESAAALAGKEIITYHNSWPYFALAFGIEVAGFVEPKPGIEPTASHTAQLITLMNTRGIKVIGKEPYFSDRTPKSIARQTDAQIVDLPTSVGGVKDATDYFALFDALLGALGKALEE